MWVVGCGLLSESGFSGLGDWQDSSDGSGIPAILVRGVRGRVAAGGGYPVKQAGGMLPVAAWGGKAWTISMGFGVVLLPWWRVRDLCRAIKVVRRRPESAIRLMKGWDSGMGRLLARRCAIGCRVAGLGGGVSGRPGVGRVCDVGFWRVGGIGVRALGVCLRGFGIFFDFADICGHFWTFWLAGGLGVLGVG